MTEPTYDGRVPYRRPGGSPKPSRFAELVQAHIDHDTNLVAEIEAQYIDEEAGR